MNQEQDVTTISKTMHTLFALFMDHVVFPVVWLLSPAMRQHQRYVRLQNAHLDRTLHRTPDRGCWYCRAGVEYRMGPDAPQDPDWWQDQSRWDDAVYGIGE